MVKIEDIDYKKDSAYVNIVWGDGTIKDLIFTGDTDEVMEAIRFYARGVKATELTVQWLDYNKGEDWMCEL